MAELYDQAVCYVNGVLLVENTSISVSYEGDDQDVMTIVKGWAGQTPSPRKMVIKIAERIPRGGPEFDFIGAFLDSTKVTFGVMLIGAGKKLESEGFLRAPGAEFGVGQTADLGVEFHGEPKNFS